ncbi:hypothetical protein ACEPPN_012312 [Leptodophora sp. 'Broadleaf-Isolate-01']
MAWTKQEFLQFSKLSESEETAPLNSFETALDEKVNLVERLNNKDNSAIIRKVPVVLPYVCQLLEEEA